MTFHLDHDFLLLGKEEHGFSKNYFYEWDDGGAEHKTRLFLNFHLHSTEIPGAEIGDVVFATMKKAFFEHMELDPADRFEDMLKEVNAAVHQKEEALGVKFLPNVHVLAVAMVGSDLYLSQRGDAEAYLVRRRFVSEISEGLFDPKNNDELFQNIASGELTSGDYVFLCSSRLIRYITKSDLGRVLSSEISLGKALKAIEQSVSIDLRDRMSILGVFVGEEEKVETLIEGEESVEEVIESSNDGVLAGFGKSLKLKLGSLVPERSDVSGPKEYEDDSDRVPSSDMAALLQEWKELKRDKILMALVAMVLILLIGIWAVRSQGKKQHYIEGLETKLDEVELNLNTSRTTGAYDKESAKELLDQSEELALEVLNSGYLRGKASEFLTEIELQRDRIDNVRRIENPDVAVDFLPLDPEMNALGIVPMGDSLYVFEHDTLYEIMLDEVQEPKLIDADEVAIDAAYYDDNESLLFLTKAGRVIEYKDGEFSFVDTDDAAWRSGVDIEVYNGRIYLLDPKEGQIWRYYPQRNGFSEADDYVTDTSLALKGARSFAIDGAVYVLDEVGEVHKLFSGEGVDDFNIQKAPATDLTNATVLFTEFEMFQAYVLDPIGNRIFAYNKDARSGDLVYNGQYILENVEELRDIYVDKETSRMYILGKSKVYVLTI